jgi:hypothetical protein
MRDSRIVNNTVIDINSTSPGPPWIRVTAHKDGTPSSNVVVRNNLATDFSLSGINVSSDHDIEYVYANAGNFFVAPPYDVHLLPTASAIDAGSPASSPAIDIEGIPRPQGAAVDVGAHEWGPDHLFADGFDGN